MYAIIDDGGKQYKVEQGDLLAVELRDLADDQTTIEFDQVLYLRDDQNTLIGQPRVDGARVIGKINGRSHGPKLHPLKFRRRKNSLRRTGHRQKYLEVEITEIVRP
ncbi:MAG: 50S ribosomal protein L21 [Sedimentisphaerales bacterium]|nr:50S ribosomal protein L21 [Sedimentisphaerales bacterium]